jgi:hypothetical protein
VLSEPFQLAARNCKEVSVSGSFHYQTFLEQLNDRNESEDFVVFLLWNDTGCWRLA